MKRYELRVVIHEGNDEYWESLKTTNKTGADDVTRMVRDALDMETALIHEVTLVKYEDTDEAC